MNRQKLIIAFLLVLLLAGVIQYYRVVNRYREGLFTSLYTGLSNLHFALQQAIEAEDASNRSSLISSASHHAMVPTYILLGTFQVLPDDVRRMDIVDYWLRDGDTSSLSTKTAVTDADLTAFADRVWKLRLALLGKGPDLNYVSVKELRARVDQLADELGLRPALSTLSGIGP